MAGPAHPALEFHQHQLIGAIDQRQVIDGAVPLTTVMQGEMEAIAAEAADLGIAANNHIKGGTQPGHAATQFRPAHHHGDVSQITPG